MNINRMAHIVTAASAFPDYYYRQEDITAAMQKLWAGRPSGLERLESFHQNMQIHGRYLALPIAIGLTAFIIYGQIKRSKRRQRQEQQ